MVGFVGSDNFKEVFILLTKMVAVQIRIFLIEIKKPGF